MSSIERRLARFLANERIVVPVIWKLFLAQVLAPFCGQQLHFVLDNTPIRSDLTIVYLGLVVHSRVLPVAWAVMPAQTKWDEGQWQIVGWLLDQVRVHLPDTCCTLLADRGLTGMALVKLCTARGWHYLLRVCREHTRARVLSTANWNTRGSVLTRSCGTARLSLVWHSRDGPRGDAGHLCQPGLGPRL